VDEVVVVIWNRSYLMQVALMMLSVKNGSQQNRNTPASAVTTASLSSPISIYLSSSSSS